jgi:hypothetical protein
MDNLSITVSAAGRPLFTSRVRSLSVGESQPPKPATPPTEIGQAAQPSPPERGSGVGEKAQAALFEARASEAPSPDGLTDAERDQVKELRARDAEVRRHEEAHARVGGQYAGQPSYSYQTGPDGKRYAIGGEVSIDIAPVAGDPEATIQKMEIVKRAALAPAEPSGQDRKVAALADAQRLEAVAELSAQRLAEQFEGGQEDATGAVGPARDLGNLAGIIRSGPENAPGQEFDLAA